MPLPNFLIIGAQKSGTTWMAQNLGRHPDVFMPDREIHFFDKDYNFSKGIEWYSTHFAAAKRQRAIGEKTPDYLWANGRGAEGHLPDVHRNIYQVLPESKLVAILRNPVERAISAVNHIRWSGRISRSAPIDELLVGGKQHLVEAHGVIDYGRYHRQLKAYGQYFDPEQILVLVYEEDIVRDPGLGLGRVCRFIGVDPSFEFPLKSQRFNRTPRSKIGLLALSHLPLAKPFINRVDPYLSKAQTRPSKAAIDALYEIYAEDNKRLYDLLEHRPTSWNNAAPTDCA